MNKQDIKLKLIISSKEFDSSKKEIEINCSLYQNHNFRNYDFEWILINDDLSLRIEGNSKEKVFNEMYEKILNRLKFRIFNKY